VAYFVTAHIGALSHLYPVLVWWAIFLSLYWPGLFGWLGEAHSRSVLERATGAVNVAWGIGFAVGPYVGGMLYRAAGRLVFLVAPLAPAAACVLLFMSRTHVQTPPPADPAPHRRHGLRRRLWSAWLGLLSTNVLFGLMSGVFPDLGEQELGVTSDIFGMLLLVLGLGRLAVFFLGMRGGGWTHRWAGAVATQVAAAGLVATVAWANSHVWLSLVFGVVGFAVGVTYQRSLYASLAEEGPRQRRSGVHEASLVAGVLLGGLIGGYLAHWIGLRAPYVPAAGLVLLLVVVQAVLASSARRARAGRTP
jgi:predicted MFS family arabinose efflux permease